MPVDGMMLVAFTEIDGLADRVGLYEGAVPEEAGSVVALAEIVRLAEGSDEEIPKLLEYEGSRKDEVRV